jgi:hypothetical protein
MRKRFAVPAGLLGMLAGALVGSAYLSKAGSCTDPNTPAFSCVMNTSVAPFVGCVALGFVVGIAIAHFLSSGIDRAIGSISVDQSGPGLALERASAPKRAPAPRPMPVRAPESRPERVPEPGGEPPPQPREGVSLGSRGRPKPRPR